MKFEHEQGLVWGLYEFLDASSTWWIKLSMQGLSLVAIYTVVYSENKNYMEYFIVFKYLLDAGLTLVGVENSRNWKYVLIAVGFPDPNKVQVMVYLWDWSTSGNISEVHQFL